MMPILRPGSMVLVDTSVCRIEEVDWKNEYDRPIYFVELHDGYRCGWFHKNRKPTDDATSSAFTLWARGLANSR